MAVVQYTFTYKQYIEQHSRHKQYIGQHNSLIRKSADRAQSLRGIPWHLPYNWAHLAHYGGRIVSPTHRPPLPPQDILVLISLKVRVNPQEHTAISSQLKKSQWQNRKPNPRPSDCSAVPQPTVSPPTAILLGSLMKLTVSFTLRFLYLPRVFTARYGLIPYIKQITFRLLKVKLVGHHVTSWL